MMSIAIHLSTDPEHTGSIHFK